MWDTSECVPVCVCVCACSRVVGAVWIKEALCRLIVLGVGCKRSDLGIISVQVLEIEQFIIHPLNVKGVEKSGEGTFACQSCTFSQRPGRRGGEWG